MRKRFIAFGVMLLLICTLLIACASKKEDTAEDVYKNYKQYDTSFGLKYWIPNDWNKYNTSTNTDITFTKDEDEITNGLIGIYYYEFDGDILQKDTFNSFVNNIKNREDYNGNFRSKSSTINGIKVKIFSYKVDINDNNYIMKGAVFNCGNGYSILDFIYPTDKDSSDIFNNILNSIHVDTSVAVTATNTQDETTTSTTEEQTTTEATTEVTTEKTTQVKPKSKDITDKTIDVSTYRNDSTGKWRIATTSDDFDIEKYALSYYLNYFDADDEIHVIVNFTRMTTTKISDMGDTLDVSIHEYTKGEEHDANKALGGMLLNEYHVNIKTGKITKIQ